MDELAADQEPDAIERRQAAQSASQASTAAPVAPTPQEKAAEGAIAPTGALIVAANILLIFRPAQPPAFG